MLHHLKRHNLVQAADSISNQVPRRTRFERRWKRLLDLPHVGDVRGMGLLLAVEFVADKKTKEPFAADKNFAGRVGQLAAQRGVLVYPMQGSVDGISGDHVLVAPPAVIAHDQIRVGRPRTPSRD